MVDNRVVVSGRSGKTPGTKRSLGTSVHPVVVLQTGGPFDEWSSKTGIVGIDVSAQPEPVTRSTVDTRYQNFLDFSGLDLP